MTTQKTKKHLLVNLTESLVLNWSTYLSWLIPYAIGALTFWVSADLSEKITLGEKEFNKKNLAMIFILLCTLTDFFIRASNLNKKTVTLNELKEENHELTQKNNESEETMNLLANKLIDSTANHVSKTLALLLDESLRNNDKVRVSLYAHEENSFYLCGRHSADPIFSKTNRFVFPENEGCIGMAWRNGTHFESSLPDSSTDSSEYARQQKEIFGIPQKDVKNLRMKSRCYYAHAISYDTTRLGVIVFESINCGILSEEKLSFLTTSNSESLVSIIDNARDALLIKRAFYEQS